MKCVVMSHEGGILPDEVYVVATNAGILNVASYRRCTASCSSGSVNTVFTILVT
jgi:hypothetical protein